MYWLIRLLFCLLLATQAAAQVPPGPAVLGWGQNSNLSYAPLVATGFATSSIPPGGSVVVWGQNANGTYSPISPTNAGCLGATIGSTIIPCGGSVSTLTGVNFGWNNGTVSIQSGTTYTFKSSDCGTLVQFTSATAVTATVPNNLTPRCTIWVAQIGAGVVSVNGTAVTPATLNSPTGVFSTTQWLEISVDIYANAGGSSAQGIVEGILPNVNVTWPTSGQLVVSNATNSPAGVAGTVGALAMYGASGWTALAAGATAGQCLETQGSLTVLHFASCAATISLTASTPSLLFSPSPITGTGTIGTTNAEIGENAATTTFSGTTACAGNDGLTGCYPSAQTIEGTDTANQAFTLPVASTTGYGSGFAFTIIAAPAHTATITPTTSTIGGASSLVLAANCTAVIWTNAAGTNYEDAATCPTVGSGNLTVGTSTIASGTNTDIEYNNNGTLGEYAISGTGTTVAMTAGPTFTGTGPSITATTQVTPAQGALGLAGLASTPTPGASEEGWMWLSAAGGLNTIGEGTTCDQEGYNEAKTLVTCIVANTGTFAVGTTSVLNTSDVADFNISTSALAGITVSNTSANAAAGARICLENNTAACEGSIYVESSAGSGSNSMYLTNPSNIYTTVNSAGAIYLQNSGANIVLPNITNADGNDILCWQTGGLITYEATTGGCTGLSDPRVKGDEVQAPGLQAILCMNGITFDWLDVNRKKKDGRQIGINATDAQKCGVPELVGTKKHPVPMILEDGSTQLVQGALYVNYDRLSVLEINAIHDMQKEITDLQARMH